MGVTSFSRALAFALSMASMILTKSVHPPGGGLVVLYMDSGLLRSLGAWCVVSCGCESFRCGCPAYVRSYRIDSPNFPMVLVVTFARNDELGRFLIWPGLASGLYVYCMASLFRSLRSFCRRRFAFC